MTKIILNYRISSNNSRGRLFLFSHQKGAIIRGRRLFQIFLTGGRALNIFQAIKEKVKYVNITIEKTVKKPVLLKPFSCEQLNESLFVTQDVNF